MYRIDVSTATACDSGAVQTGAMDSSICGSRSGQFRRRLLSASGTVGADLEKQLCWGANTGSVRVKGGCFSAAFISELGVGPQ